MPKRKTEQPRAALPSKPYEPTDADRQVVRSHLDRRRQSRQAPKVKVDHKPSKPVQIEPDHPDPVVGGTALSEAFASVEMNFVNQQLGDLINVLQSQQSKPISEAALNGALATINGIGPADEVEAMIATQMVATNHVAMELMRRTRQSEMLNNIALHGNLAVKFLRTFTAQLEALQRYRGKGQQKIVVERVNVSEGGQAIVGTVERSGQGGGSREKTEEQSHAKKNGDAPKSPLRSEDEAGDGVPGAGG